MHSRTGDLKRGKGGSAVLNLEAVNCFISLPQKVIYRTGKYHQLQTIISLIALGQTPIFGLGSVHWQ